MSFFQSNFFKKGLPFLLFLAGGSYALSTFTSIRYEFSKTQGAALSPEEKKIWNEMAQASEKVDIVEEYNKMKENLDVDNWTNVRGPRPWEEDEQKYIDIINKRREEREELSKKKRTFWV